MQIGDLLGVVAPVGLHQHHHGTEANPMDGEPQTIAITGLFRWSPPGGDGLSC